MDPGVIANHSLSLSDFPDTCAYLPWEVLGFLDTEIAWNKKCQEEIFSAECLGKVKNEKRRFFLI